ncbi:MAG: arsenite methyltransferase, partial [Proteobacteria bacterium]|nr:arsenite methyltransferase [Pseudomonadota bacterium]NIS72150.1 arsenite methyltransferase [Pseudomonadota bacterium]
MKNEKVKTVVRESYARIAKQNSSCCGPPKSCCGGPDPVQNISERMGYTQEDLKAVPEGANLGLGCGNPVALASLKEGETVLDLGSGAGFDCFLAAQRVGQQGKVIGVDMTPEMIDNAREHAKKGAYQNVEFRLGEIENLPAADGSVDAVISNCVINLSPEKRRVFAEAFRVLKPGGRLMISDIVLLKELPESIKNSIEAYVGCISGALERTKYLQAIEAAGFQDLRIMNETAFPIEFLANDPVGNAIIQESNIPQEKLKDFDRSVASISVHATKPS